MLKKLCFIVLTLKLIILLRADNDVKDYRLPKVVKPISYGISITINEDFPTTKKFNGFAKIMVNVSKETDTIVMHSANITYEKSDKYRIEFMEDVEKLILKFDKPLKVGTQRIDFKYVGVLHEDMNGFYLSYYENEITKEKEWIATTQFQPPYARRAFPCFDEPEFKAEFQVNITRPYAFNSLSNSILQQTKKISSNMYLDVYKATPKMSTYLVAFIVSKFKSFSDLNHKNNKQYDVYGTDSMLKIANHAYECGQKFIDRLSKYTAMDYYEAGIPKLNLVAIPDFNAGAMENWGLVTFRETDLLYDEKESPAVYKSQVATVIAHELSHLWFGDMVTLEWWSFTWLNEGFAEYFSYYITEMIEDKWEVLNRYIVTDLQSIFKTDALSGSIALTSNVSSPEEIADKFNLISYAKGAAIVRMMHFILEDKPFLMAIRDYLKTNLYKNTKPADLWFAFSKYTNDTRLPENVDFASVMTTWTEQPGFPLVHATLKGKEVVLTQKRFLLNESSADTTLNWYIPITYTTTATINFTDNNIVWLKPNKTLNINPNFKGPSDWVMINLKQYGFYRVLYDDNLQNRLINLLKSDNYVDIDVMNRAQFVDDMFNLAQAKQLKYASVLDMTTYLSRESDYYPWKSAIRGFSYLLVRSGSDKTLIKHILNVMGTLYDSVSFNIDNISYMDTLRTAMTLEFACNLDHQDCINKANALFEDYKRGKYLNPNLRKTVYCSALRKSHTIDNWKFLWNQYLNATLATEKHLILISLACTKERNTLRDYLKKTITDDSHVRKQDAIFVFDSIISSGPVGFEEGYKFFKANINKITKYYGDLSTISDMVLSIAELITTQEQLDDLEKFLIDHPNELKDATGQIKNAIENAKSNLNWPKEDVLNWLNTKYNSSDKFTVNIFGILICMVLIFYF